MPATYVPNRGLLHALHAERQRYGPGDYSGGWLDRAVINESRNIAASTLRAVACGWEVSDSDLRWASAWVAGDEGWRTEWTRLPGDEVSP